MKRIFLSLVCLFLLIGTASAIPPFPPGCSSVGCNYLASAWATYFASTYLPMSGAYTAGHLLGMDATGTYIVDVGAPVTMGTGVATAAAINIGTAGSFVVSGGALGTPSSGNLSSCSGYPADATKVSVVSNVSTYMGANVQSVNETSEAATCNWANGSTCVIAGDCASNGTVTMSAGKACTVTCSAIPILPWH
jgi:hypothetical protein